MQPPFSAASGVEWTQNSSFVKPCRSARRILLVAAANCHESDLFGALRSSKEVQSSALPVELVFFPCHTMPSSWLCLIYLTASVRGFFEAVYLAPPAATWSRLRSSSTEGQPPLRSREEPLGLSSLNPEESDKVRQSNIQWELVVWLADQSAGCKERKVATEEKGPLRRGRLERFLNSNVRVTCGVARHSCASSQAQTSGVQSGFSQTCRP